MTSNQPIVYAPCILKNLTEICAKMGVGKETVRDWIDKGAPIVVESDKGRPRYSAEMAALQLWRLQQNS